MPPSETFSYLTIILVEMFVVNFVLYINLNKLYGKFVTYINLYLTCE